jgi:hypothetical protein
MIQKGMITPELTESILAAVAPEMIKAARDAQQAQSVAPIPPDIAEALNAPAPEGGEAPAPAPQEEAAPAQETTPPLAEPEV